MDFKNAAKFGSFISKDYAKPLFKLLLMYKSISASEAASRLGIHIRTVQDFMEAMTELEILTKEEVYERKRPYFRYTLKKNTIKLELNLADLVEGNNDQRNGYHKIREQKNSGARFTTARNGQFFSSIAIWEGKGRDGKERRINLTESQGRFLFNLPFPNADFMSQAQIMEKAEINNEHDREVADIIKLLIEYGIVEVGD